MNVVTNLTPSPSETAKLAARQDRGGSSKQGGSGFSDTLGSFEKKTTTPAQATSGSADKAAPEASTAEAGSQTVVDQDAEQTAPTPTTVAAPVKGASSAPVAQQPAAPSANGQAFVELSLLTGIPVAPATGLPATTNVAQGPVEMPTEPLNPADVAAMTDALGDLAKLVNALTNVKTTEATMLDGEEAEGVDDGTTDEDASTPDTGTVDADLLSLLVATALPKEQTVQQTEAPAGNQMAKNAVADIAGLAQNNQMAEGDVTTSATVVRLTKQDAPSIDLHIDTADDGSVQVDASLSSGANIDVVQVVDSRRFLAPAATSNVAAITSAMTTDPDWSTAMSNQTSAPLVTSSGDVVHTLKIQMNPVELGHVTAAMKLVGDELSVHLTAHTLKGYAELQKDGSSIVDALKAQGFTVDQVTVSLSSAADRQDSATGNRQPGGDTNQQSAQQGSQRGNDDRPQEQFYRQSRTGAPEDAISNDIMVQPETSDRGTGARPGHVYL